MSTDNGKGLLFGFLSGALIGGAIALLYAPKPGKELRGDLLKKSGELADDLEDYMQDAQSKARDIINEGKDKSSALIAEAKEKADGLLKDAETIMQDAKHKVGGEGTKVKTALKAGVDAYKEERAKAIPPTSDDA